jgi:hypothetical protein
MIRGQDIPESSFIVRDRRNFQSSVFLEHQDYRWPALAVAHAFTPKWRAHMLGCGQ